MKNSSDTTGNRTRDLPTCSAVPQLRHRVATYSYVVWLRNHRTLGVYKSIGQTQDNFIDNIDNTVGVDSAPYRNECQG
jgi:hypothetical protein